MGSQVPSTLPTDEVLAPDSQETPSKKRTLEKLAQEAEVAPRKVERPIKADAGLAPNEKLEVREGYFIIRPPLKRRATCGLCKTEFKYRPDKADYLIEEDSPTMSPSLVRCAIKKCPAFSQVTTDDEDEDASCDETGARKAD